MERQWNKHLKQDFNVMTERMSERIIDHNDREKNSTLLQHANVKKYKHVWVKFSKTDASFGIVRIISNIFASALEKW